MLGARMQVPYARGGAIKPGWRAGFLISLPSPHVRPVVRTCGGGKGAILAVVFNLFFGTSNDLAGGAARRAQEESVAGRVELAAQAASAQR